MAGKVVLAVAGAGKTTWLGKQVDPQKRNVLITYTNENVKNIEKSVRNENNGQIPPNTQIMTYTKFVFYWMIQPFQKQLDYLYENARLVLSIQELGKKVATQINGQAQYTNKIAKKKIGHYSDYNPEYEKSSQFVYANSLSELILDQKKMILKKICKYLDMFLDNLYVDEFQDFTGHDFELLMELAKRLKTNVTMVGDFYQSSVSVSSRNTKPYKTISSINEFKECLTEEGLTIDEHSLQKSWRCPPKTCQFIQDNLGIMIEAHKEQEGDVIFISDKKQAKEKLLDSKIVKLIWDNRVKTLPKMEPINKWGYSKGDTYCTVCIILTGKVTNILKKAFSSHKKPEFKSPVSKNRFYVALTRAKGNTYLIDDDLYKDVLKNSKR